ncbi:MAG: hypothetical protein K9G58_06410 [Bacteroidales bacterium]|nr:hypothetical protein [Bacteroidales bacterium]MCF8386568.1 hypothetical protein [Bacteroidales bacterium]MCF8397781.1 hypothetical protein [Bacteroidales bacterium]
MNNWEEKLKAIMHDNRSGSTGILEKTLQALQEHLRKSSSLQTGRLVDQLNRLFSAHSGMIVLFHFINSFFLRIEDKALMRKGDAAKEELLSFLAEYLNQWQGIEQQIAEHLLEKEDLSRKTILLHSNTAVVLKTLEVLSEKSVFPRIYQTISYPAEEGKIQAEKLAEMGFMVRVISDASVARFADEMDLALFGSDGIFTDHFVNKTGTHLYARLFHDSGKAAYVLSDSRKLINEKDLPPALFEVLKTEEEKDADELWKNAAPNVRLLNFYFEDIPNDLLNGFILESGFVCGDALANHLREFRLSELFKFEEQAGF